MTPIRRTAAVQAAVVLFLGVGLEARAQEEPPPTLVITATVTSEPITETVSLLGNARPLLDSLVASEVEGRVARRLVENGDRVSRGEALFRLDSTRLEKDLAVARAEEVDVTAQLDLAVLQENRAQDLHRDQVVAQRDLDEAVTRRQSMEGRLHAIQARIEAIEDDIARTAIRSPFAGIVTEVRTEVGEWIETGDPVVRLSNLDTIEIRLEVPEQYFPYLTRGAAAPAKVEALPGTVLEGKIFALVPRAHENARTFPVLVRAPNPDGQVGAGMLTRVELALSRGGDALLVPKDAIVQLAQQQIVFVVQSDEVSAVTVRTGRASGDRVEVFGDLREGESVVVRGNERLEPGQKVRVQTASAKARD